jgi:hypothetical protein
MGSLQGLVSFLGFLWAATVISTIVLAVKKGYNGFLAFLLGLFIPLLGSLIVIALLPNKYESSTVGIVKTGTSSSGKSSGINLSKVSSDSPTKVNTGETWVCKKCNERNPIIASQCKGCGAYK